MSDVLLIEPISMHEISSRFPLTFEHSADKISDVKSSLLLRPNGKPVFIKPRKIPYAIRSAVNAELEKDGIIKPAEEND